MDAWQQRFLSSSMSVRDQGSEKGVLVQGLDRTARVFTTCGRMRGMSPMPRCFADDFNELLIELRAVSPRVAV
jgi:hypothetical protein